MKSCYFSKCVLCRLAPLTHWIVVYIYLTWLGPICVGWLDMILYWSGNSSAVTKSSMVGQNPVVG